MNNPVEFKPINIGENVNTDGDEYINQILPDGSKIYFTRRLQEKMKMATGLRNRITHR